MANRLSDLIKDRPDLVPQADTVGVADVEDKVMLINSLEIKPSQFGTGNYIECRVTIEGKERIFTTSASRIMVKLLALKNYLPLEVSVYKSGRHYDIR